MTLFTLYFAYISTQLVEAYKEHAYNSALRRCRQEDLQVEVSLDYIVVRPCLKKKKKREIFKCI